MSQVNNRRIAKNTLLLYLRTAFSMFISLFTSRVTLQVLGVDDFGTQAAVAGVMSMFVIVTSSMTASISRFITFELGRGDRGRLQKIFSTSVNLQLLIGAGILLLGETLGVWFLNTHMNIPDGRMEAANWVLQFAIFSFVIDLTQTPYKSFIVGYEHMSVFAYFGMADSVLRLLIVYLLYVSPFDKLVTISILSFAVSVLLRMLQRLYCVRHFPECHYLCIIDRSLVRQMFGFAGWNFFTSTNYILNNQGVTVLINMFFGVAANAARGIATRVEGLVMHLVGNFSTAVAPQITKSYAAGELEAMHVLVCRAAKFSFFAMLLISLPLICEAETVLHLWLGLVPGNTPLLVRLSLVLGLEDVIGSSGYTACMATGRLKKYAVVLFWIGALEFPLTWASYALGAPLEAAYYAYIVVKAVVLLARMFLLEEMVKLPHQMYVSRVFVPIVATSLLAVLPSLAVSCFLPATLWRLLLSIVVGVGSVSLFSLYVGMTRRERKVILSKVGSAVHGRFRWAHS